MDYSMPGLPVHDHLLEFTQTHVHWVSDAIQPFYPLLSPSSPAFNLSQHLGLFQWVSASHQVAKVLEFQLQHQSFQWTLRTPLGWLDFHAGQGTLKSLLQHHSSKASILRRSAFFIVQHSHHTLVYGRVEICSSKIQSLREITWLCESQLAVSPSWWFKYKQKQSIFTTSLIICLRIYNINLETLMVLLHLGDSVDFVAHTIT